MGELGSKLIAFAFGLSLMITTYLLSRKALNMTWSLLVVLLVSGFQVISWQSSSFYVDIAKAYWELTALYFLLINSDSLKTSLAFGASLASKLFSIFLLPVVILLDLIKSGRKNTVKIILISLLVVSPFYLFAFQVSGNPFYSLFTHIDKLSEIGGTPSLFGYLLQRLLQLPSAAVLIAISREYTSPILLGFLPLLVFKWKEIRKNKLVLSLTIFSLYQFLIWWFLPPTSVRYALSGFITAMVVTLYLIQKVTKQSLHQKVIYAVLVIGVLAMPIRVAVAWRSWQYISGSQSKEEYLQQFYDGNIDRHLEKWEELMITTMK